LPSAVWKQALLLVLAVCTVLVTLAHFGQLPTAVPPASVAEQSDIAAAELSAIAAEPSSVAGQSVTVLATIPATIPAEQ
jgi:hypothetical protein